VKALAWCKIMTWIHRTESVGPTWRIPSFSQTWNAQCYRHTIVIQKLSVTSNTTVQYMEPINDSTKAKASGCNNLHESRFKKLLFIFRQGGLPLKLKPVSKIYRIYSATIMVCFYVTTACLFMDMLVHRRQLDYAMKKLRVFLAFGIALWLHISFR
jgi:hypothetical protein